MTAILSSAIEPDGVTKMQIMYQSYLSFAHLLDYLAIMKKDGYLQFDNETERYRTTDKGLTLLEVCESITSLVGEAHDY